MAYSERAVSDIKRLLDNKHLIEQWNLKFIVREFVPIPVEGEFRGFVHKGQLNALSQYYADSYFPGLPARRQKLGDCVLQFFNAHIRSRVPIDSYIIDFAVLKDDGSDIRIVELNPFGPATGGCLFHWNRDRSIIENGPFEVRVNSCPINGVDSLLLPWSRLLQDAKARAQAESKHKGPCIIM